MQSTPVHSPFWPWASSHLLEEILSIRVSVSVCPSVHPPVHASVSPSIHLSIYPHNHPSSSTDWVSAMDQEPHQVLAGDTVVVPFPGDLP